MSDQQQITIQVNSQSMKIPRGTTICGLLSQLEIHQSAIAVEKNAKICTRSAFASTQIQAGDSFEIVSLVGGG